MSRGRRGREPEHDPEEQKEDPEPKHAVSLTPSQQAIVDYITAHPGALVVTALGALQANQRQFHDDLTHLREQQIVAVRQIPGRKQDGLYLA
jgi:hypothetical protein